MDTPKISDELFNLLHRQGWSIGDTAFTEDQGKTWLIYGTQGGCEIRAEDSDRGEA